MSASVGFTTFALSCAVLLTATASSAPQPPTAPVSPTQGQASFYGEAHRGKLMANGKKFDPQKLTAASWFFPLGTRLQVTRADSDRPLRSIVVTVTDRGPAQRLVQQGRIIDLSESAFRVLSAPAKGLVQVKIDVIE